MAASDAIGYRERAAFYAVEYREDGDRPFIEGLLDEDARNVLEVPCGAGRNALWLAETGRCVTACDIEPAMLEALAARYPGGRPPANLTLAQADMRAFQFDKRFDLILIPREAIQLLPAAEDVAATLDCCRRHLAPGGRLVVDLAAFKAPASGSSDQDDMLQPSYYRPGQPDGVECFEWERELADGRRMKRWRRQWDKADSVDFALRYQVCGDASGGGASEWVAEMTLRKYSMSQFRKLAAGAHLNIVHAYGSYDNRVYRDGDVRMILCLQPDGQA
ncbi:class I SAM-dependent methyltransferase [Ferruginivarius sediminum]|uniref:Class I SAM-dependent methyltransferase n=1 Tax=Ferruginivarius sediminum TaxID=2661937 RepID=A0A369TFR1_9PROT|nr:class I SAM-dependent methyltransferase [Ferruginivarius sediminum]RDD62957.1 class I SAM-dependent methyltransferase [Ferruginivarius sediminum]